MSHPSPYPAFQHKTMSVSAELRPLCQLTSVKEEAPEEELNSLSSLAEKAFNFHFEKSPFMPTISENSAHIGLGCPINCACVCHLPSPLPAVNVYRPSVIMAPVARERRASTLTHFPLTMQTEEKLEKTSRKTCRRKTMNKVIVEKRKKASSSIQREGDNVLCISDRENHFLRVDIDGQTAKFKLSKRDWELMDINVFPSGGRLLGGAWTTIFKCGVKKSNHWCSVRFTNNHVRTENSRKVNSAPFFRGTAECKRPECSVKMKFTIHEERGKYVRVTYVGNVYHKVGESSVAKKKNNSW